MSKIMTIGWTEYLSAVRSKAFIIGIIMMPIMMGGSLIAKYLSESNVDLQERKFAILDESDGMYELLEAALEVRNSEIFETVGEKPVQGGMPGLPVLSDGSSDGAGSGSEAEVTWEPGEMQEKRQVKPTFSMERYEHDANETRSPELVLSDRVRSGELFAFLIVGKNVFEPDRKPKDYVNYHSASPTYGDLPKWIKSTIQDEVETSRFQSKNIDPELVKDMKRRVNFDERSLVEETVEGEEIGGEEENDFESYVIPIASVIMLFMLIMMAAPQALNVVLEEKMQKISEVLISAVSPFQLMMGKLVGTVLLSMTLSAVYLGAVVVATHYFEVESMVPGRIYAWFLLFQLMALAIFSSLFAAVGAACSEMRDAQSLITPGMMILMIPMFFLGVVVESPDSTLSVALSLFPPATPMIMMLRVAIEPGPPMWQLILSVVLTVAFTAACIWAAGKVFRIGLLSSGQAPTMKKLIGWVFSK